MKSRLAVSVLFILIAATFAPDAIDAFGKLRSWTCKLCDRYSIQACDRVIFRNSAPTSALKAGHEARAAMICLDGGRQPLCQNCATGTEPCVGGAISPVGSDHRSESFQFLRTAVRQIHEVLYLMSIK
jgi:hypothetical protein